MLSCKKATVLISQAQERNLSTGEKAQLKLHLWLCRACSNFQTNVGGLRQAMQRFNSSSADDASDSKDKDQ